MELRKNVYKMNDEQKAFIVFKDGTKKQIVYGVAMYVSCGLTVHLYTADNEEYKVEEVASTEVNENRVINKLNHLFFKADKTHNFIPCDNVHHIELQRNVIESRKTIAG